jgi:hypothetical protein
MEYIDTEISKEDIKQQLHAIGIEVPDTETELNFEIWKIKTKVLDYLNWRSGAQQESRSARERRELWNRQHESEIKADYTLERLPDTTRDKIPPELVPYVIDMICGDYVSTWLTNPENFKVFNRFESLVTGVSTGRASYSYENIPMFEKIQGAYERMDTWNKFPHEVFAPYRKLHRELEYLYPVKKE